MARGKEASKETHTETIVTSRTGPEGTEPPGPAPSASNKRKRPTGRAAYPRKRALAACETCRLRKTKCDNNRPACGGCAELEIECVFRDSASDPSTYDRASLEILERVNYVAELLEGFRSGSQGAQNVSPAGFYLGGQTAQMIQHSTEATGLIKESTLDQGQSQNPSPESWTRPLDTHRGDGIEEDDFLESLEISGHNPGICEDILNWPVFGGPFDRTKMESLVFRPSSLVDRQVRQDLNGSKWKHSRSVGVNEEHAPGLVERFLVNVHIKNPVLDPDELRRSARRIAENGFGWDETSCLLLLVSALSTISSDFTSEPVTPDIVEGPSPLTSLAETENYSTAEAYYNAARKRLGMLDYTVTSAQCHFIAGVYEMYSLRTITAWGSFNRASGVLQIYFRGQAGSRLPREDEIISRLYWSCLKSECEMRMEIDLPPSGLARAAYSDVFPSPPDENVSQANEQQAVSPSSRPQQEVLEQIWAYYLSEIAVRKIGNRIMNCFYREEASSWLSMRLTKMSRIAEELEAQLTQWFDNLPATLMSPLTNNSNNNNNDNNPSSVGEANSRIANELRFVLHARLSDFRERLYRPFLYLAIHLPASDPKQAELAPYLHRCLNACMIFLTRGTPRHRHHGTWYENRGMFLKSILLIAVARSGIVGLPPMWRDGIGLCIAGFKFWEAEAPDLEEARHVLTSLLAELD